MYQSNEEASPNFRPLGEKKLTPPWNFYKSQACIPAQKKLKIEKMLETTPQVIPHNFFFNGWNFVKIPKTDPVGTIGNMAGAP